MGHVVEQLPQRQAHVLPAYQDGEWLLSPSWGVGREGTGASARSDGRQGNGDEPGKEGEMAGREGQ